MIELYGEGPFACVLDLESDPREIEVCSALSNCHCLLFLASHCLQELLQDVGAEMKVKHGTMYLRAQQGDHAHTALAGLRAAETVFGCTRNTKVSD